MTYYLANKTAVTKSGFPASADADPVMVLSADVYEKLPYHYEKGPDAGVNADAEGGNFTLKYPAGTKLRQSTIDKLFRAVTVSSITASAATAGGTVITVRGTDLHTVTAISIGGNAGTSIVKVSPSQLRFTAPAHAAGAVTTTFTNAAGASAAIAGVTYA